jgi:hypothetical protein
MDKSMLDCFFVSPFGNKEGQMGGGTMPRSHGFEPGDGNVPYGEGAAAPGQSQVGLTFGSLEI